MNREAYDSVSRIPADEWRNIALDLERYALSVSRNLRWRTRNPVELPGGETVSSIVSKAVEKLFSAEREWDPQKEPDIKKYLRGVIDSLLNHLAESQDNILVTVVPEPGSTNYPAWETGSQKRDPSVDWLVPPNRSPEARPSAWIGSSKSCVNVLRKSNLPRLPEGRSYEPTETG